MLTIEAVKYLNRKEIPQSPAMAAVVLLLTLKSRTEQNISADALASYEDSGDWGLGGLISQDVPLKLFELIAKHYASVVSKAGLK